MTKLNPPDQMPDVLAESGFIDSETSVPVLALDKWEWFVAFACRDTDTGEINWYTNCSETWNKTDAIIGWVNLPNKPDQQNN